MIPFDDPLHDREIGARDSTLDTTRIDDVRIGAVRPLITPALLQERVPVRDDTLPLVEASRKVANLPAPDAGEGGSLRLPPCPKCSQPTLIRQEGCDLCTTCGYSKCA